MEEGGLYLVGVPVKGDVLLHAKGPVQVDFVLVEGEEEDDEDKDGVDHAEGGDHVVAQLHQTFR